MRVLHIISGRLFGGVESQLITRARYRSVCPDMEIEFALCFDGKLRELLVKTGVAVHSLGPTRTRNPLSVIRARRRLRAILEKRKPDVVSCHMPWALAMFGSTARAANIPLAFWMHGTAGGRHWLERWAKLTRPDIAICNSMYTAGTLPTLYPTLRAHMITYPVALSDVNSFYDERLTTRKSLSTLPDAVVIVQVCRMEPWKGQLLHLEALSRLRDNPNWICWIVGGAQRAAEARFATELRDSAHRLGIADRVRFTGEREDVAKILQASDIYCQPNTYPEPFGISLIEALYARLPVVSAALGGALEFIDSEVGFLVEPKPDQVAAALKQLIEDDALRRTLGAAGPARARAVSDPTTQIVRLKSVLEEVVANHHGRSRASAASL